jgi:hypothetical protein
LLLVSLLGDQVVVCLYAIRSFRIARRTGVSVTPSAD